MSGGLGLGSSQESGVRMIQCTTLNLNVLFWLLAPEFYERLITNSRGSVISSIA